MPYRKLIMTMLALLSWPVILGQEAWGQSDPPRVEVGAHLSYLRLEAVEPNLVLLRKSDDKGIGGRITLNIDRYLSIEVEATFFPKDEVDRGNRLLALFGAKIGNHWDSVGLFVKIRPGLLRFENPTRVVAIGGCPGISQNNFALDIGGVLEFYPFRHFMVRFDAGDTIVSIDKQCPFPLTEKKAMTHNLQVNAGIGFRF